MTPDFAAGPQALGYLYQVRVAFYLGLDAPEAERIVLEGLDDIAFDDDGTAVELLQTKHHSTPANLTNSSPDLWKTIRVWSTYVHDGRVAPIDTSLILLTTSVAAPGSIAALMRGGPSRDVAKAASLLRDVARDSTNASLKPAFDAFNQLTPDLQDQLVNCITISDSYPDIVSLEYLILEKLRLAVRPEHREALFERVEGWWFAKVVRLLRGSDSTPIRVAELIAKITSVAEQFRPDALPIDFLAAVPPTTADPAADSRRFVLQLRAIALGSRRVEKAILDYYRAFEQRSRWAREELLEPTELEVYERKLVDEWERRCDVLREAQSSDESDEESLKQFGKLVFNWMDQEADFRIRDGVREEYVMRGSYHMLADNDPVRVWWHPLFAQRLAAIAATDASPPATS